MNLSPAEEGTAHGPISTPYCAGRRGEPRAFAVVGISAGPMRSAPPGPLDFCPGCCDRLLDPIRAVYQAHLERFTLASHTVRRAETNRGCLGP